MLSLWWLPSPFSQGLSHVSQRAQNKILTKNGNLHVVGNNPLNGVKTNRTNKRLCVWVLRPSAGFCSWLFGRPEFMVGKCTMCRAYSLIKLYQMHTCCGFQWSVHTVLVLQIGSTAKTDNKMGRFICWFLAKKLDMSTCKSIFFRSASYTIAQM